MEDAPDGPMEDGQTAQARECVLNSNPAVRALIEHVVKKLQWHRRASISGCKGGTLLVHLTCSKFTTLVASQPTAVHSED